MKTYSRVVDVGRPGPSPVEVRVVLSSMVVRKAFLKRYCFNWYMDVEN